MPEEEPRRGLSKEAWSAIAAIAVALITAAVTLATHFLAPTHDAPASGVTSASPATSSAASSAPAPAIDALVGRWAGTARNENATFLVNVEIAPGCAVGVRCGTIAVSHVPCRGSLYLESAQDGDFEFRVDDFVPPSSAKCTAGAGEHLRPLPDGTLRYTTTYDATQAVLTRGP